MSTSSAGGTIAFTAESISEATDGGALLTVFGKGSKTRTVRISTETMRALEVLRTESEFVFPGASVPISTRRRHGASFAPLRYVRG